MTDTVRKALSVCVDKAVHLCDAALHGTGAVSTAKTLAKVIDFVVSGELVIAGNETTDGRVDAVPAMMAEVLGQPHLTYTRKVSTDGSTL